MLKMTRYLFVLLFLSPSVFGQFSTGGGGANDSVGIDANDDGTFEAYLYPAYIQKGSNITLTVAGDTVTITAAGGSGFWSFLDSTAIIHINDSTGDTLMYIIENSTYTQFKTENVAFEFLDAAAFTTILGPSGGDVLQILAGGSNDSVLFGEEWVFLGAKNADSAVMSKKYIDDAAAGGGIWVEGTDTLFAIDSDGDTVAVFWDDDGGNVRWQVATEDQTLSLFVDTLGIGGDVISEFAGDGLTVTSNALVADLGTEIDLTSEVTGVLPNANFTSNHTLTTNDNSITLNNDNTDVDAVIYIGKPTAGAMTIGWDKTAGRVAVSDPLGIGFNDVTDSTVATLNYVKITIEDSLNEYSLTSAISTLIGDSLDNYFDTAAVVDTVQGLIANDAVLLNNIGNPSADAAINMTTRQLKLTYTNPAVADGGFEVEASGAFSGDLIHVHQHTGNPGAATTLMSLEAEDADVLALNVSNTTPGDTLASFIGGAVYMDSLEVNGVSRLVGNISTSGTVDGVDISNLDDDIAADSASWNDAADDQNYTFNVFDPDAVFAVDAEVCIDPRTQAAITITRIDVTLDADPTTELTFSLKFADAFIGFANAVVIDDTATVAGVTTVTAGFGDATVPANKAIYLLIDADPDDNITQASFKVSYTFD